MACRLVVPPQASPTATITATIPTSTPTAVQTSALPQLHPPVLRDITYCRAQEVDLKANIYFAQNAPSPVPLLIFIHGGSWSGGSKSGGMMFKGLQVLSSPGYTLASIDYRLAPEYKMPAMIEDVKCAVRSFRAHAAEYGIDPERIGVIGTSAGGHLAAMLGTADETAGFDVGEYAGYSSRVQAVVDMAGPTDLRAPFTQNSEQVALQVFGTSDPANPLFATASPLTWVSSGDAPFLIIHGEDDELVPLAQSQELYEKLSQAGVQARLITVKHAGHSMDNPGQEPSREQLLVEILNFFEDRLR